MDSTQKEQILNEYCGNEMQKLKQMCHPKISKIGGISQMDHDDLYSIALDVLRYSVERYDNSQDCKFSTYLSGNIDRKYSTYVRDRLREKRSGEAQYDEDGNRVFNQALSLDNNAEDGTNLNEKIASDFNIEDEVSEKMCLSLDENIQNYLSILGVTQRKIANLIMEGYDASDIKKKLNLSDKEYSTYMSDMKAYDKKKLLKEEDCDLEEEIIMENTTVTTSEKTKDTSYAISAIEKKLRRRQLRDDHVLQRTSGQHTLIIKSEFMSDILQGRALTQIIISEEIKDGVTMHWLIDGKQRCTNIADFMNDGFAISKNVQVYNIPYQTEKLDENGNIMYNDEGFPIPEVKTFDIRGKKFSQLPDELQDKFKEYQIPVLLNLNCTKKDIAYDIARFNRCRPMNKAQNGWTGLDETYAEYVDNILKMDFFKIDCSKTKFTKDNIKSGAMRRMIVEAIITSRYIEEYSEDVGKMCKYLTDEASESVFIDFYALIERLNSILNTETSSLFNIKNSYLWIALFDKFTELNINDKEFGKFICEFNNSLRSKEINGISFEQLEKNRSTKKKCTTKQKINHLHTLLLDYLHINKEEVQSEAIENVSDMVKNNKLDTIDTDTEIIDFVKKTTTLNVTEEDIDMYYRMLNSYKVDKHSPLLHWDNEPSLIALIAYTYENEMDLDDWIVDYFNRNNEFFADQKENYTYMLEDYKEYLSKHTEKGSAA